MNPDLSPRLLNGHPQNNNQVPPPPPNSPVSQPTRRPSTAEESPGIMGGIVDLQRGRSHGLVGAEFAPPATANEQIADAQIVLEWVQAYQAGTRQDDEAFVSLAHDSQTASANLLTVMLPNGDLTDFGQDIFTRYATREQRTAFANQTNPRTGLPRDLDGVEPGHFEEAFKDGAFG
jgi:hypothetical protein